MQKGGDLREELTLADENKTEVNKAIKDLIDI